MLHVARLLGVLGMMSLALSATGANPKPGDDLTSLQGNWKPLQCEYEGSPQMPATIMSQVTVVFDKNEYYLYFKDTDIDKNTNKPKVYRLAVANVALDPTTSPKSITFEFADGRLKGQKRHGIYELASNQLKI